ncbi:cysteine desulfurase family protein [Dehalobacterium formicoaceticum]|uniref:cysteine desulfurase family protein n=1 Tax=Dehalobacterium formicoaceticum TaxID=51515 RepID=UPI0031F697A3
MSIYLDYNASTPIDERVLYAMIKAYRKFFGNADSRTHNHGTNALQEVEKARESVAALIGVAKNEVIFTSGSTESDNMAIQGLRDYGVETGRKHIITTSIEHKAVLDTVKHLVKHDGFEADFIDPDESGRISATQLLGKVRPDTLLVSVQHVNNETGIIQPIQEIGVALAETSTFFHADATQSCGKLVDELRSIQYDFLSLAAHKFYGPQGIGAFIMRRKNNKKPPIQPLVFGGGHENGYRPGTLPVALIIGFGVASDLAQKEYKKRLAAYKKNKQTILEAVEQIGVQHIINGDQQYCMDNTLNISFNSIDSEGLMIATKQYCSVSNGSACTSNDYSPSYVLRAMGLSDERVESAIRLSWGTEPIDPKALDEMLTFAKGMQE